MTTTQQDIPAAEPNAAEQDAAGPSDAERQAQIEARLSAATRGPWNVVRWGNLAGIEGRAGEPGVYEYDTDVIGFEHNGGCGCRQSCEAQVTLSEADGSLIANAPSDIAWLLGRVQRAEREEERVRDLAASYAADLSEPELIARLHVAIAAAEGREAAAVARAEQAERERDAALAQVHQAWEDGRSSLGLDFTRPLGEDGMRQATPNPHPRPAADSEAGR